MINSGFISGVGTWWKNNYWLEVNSKMIISNWQYCTELYIFSQLTSTLVHEEPYVLKPCKLSLGYNHFLKETLKDVELLKLEQLMRPSKPILSNDQAVVHEFSDLI